MYPKSRCNCRLCIVPPHMLRVLERRGDPETAKMARILLTQDRALRDARSELVSAPMQRDENRTRGFVTTAFATTNAEGVGTAMAPLREIYDGGRKAGLPGVLKRSEGDPPTGDKETDAAYDGAGAVHNLFAKEFKRNSLDAMGMKLIATVHHRRKYNNAFWDGRQMAYGDGDGVIFRTFTEISVIGHEMSHGVVQFSGGLQYQGQSGALNESFADVFGSMTRQYVEKTDVYKSDWLIGKGILGPGINGTALRSMKTPGTAYSDATLGQDPQPYHMDYYLNTTDDNGGVHINSGIPNHAFFLYCMYMGGNSWGAPGQVWYDALQRLNNPFASFHNWATQTVQSAIGLFGLGSQESQMAKRAWRLVGVSV